MSGRTTPGTTRTRPTRAALVPLLVAVLLALLGRIAGGGWLPLGAGAALALPVAAVLLRPRLDGLEVRLTGGRGVTGGEVAVRLRVTAGRRATPPLRLLLPPGLLGGATVAVPALAAGAGTAGELVLPAPSRGTTDGLDAVLVSSAPFGLVRTRRQVRLDCRVVVHPAVGTAPTGPGAGSGASTSTVQAGAGTEVLGVRPWRSGEALTTVHARATARAGRPVVLEREREQGARLVVLVAALGSGPAWEQSVAQAAALCLQALRTGGEPVLVGAAPAVRPSREGVLDWFAGLEVAGPAAPADVARAVRAAGRDGVVVVVGAVPAGLAGARVRSL